MLAATCTAYPSVVYLFVCVVRVAQSLVFCVLCCRSLLVPLFCFLFGHCTVCLLRLTASDYPGGIFKRF